MKKKIGHVFSGEYKVGNGIFTVVDSLLANINYSKFECILYCKKKEGLEAKYKIIDETELSFKELLKKEKFDLIVFHGIFFGDYLNKFLLCKKNSIPYIVKPHGSLVEKGWSKNGLKKKIFFFLGLKYFLNQSDGIIYINEEERQSSIKLNAKTYIEPNLIQINIQSKNEFSTKTRLLFFSRIDFYHKGLDYLLSALTLLDKNIEDKIEFEFYGIGDKKSVEKLKDFILKHNLNFVNYRGGIKSDNEKEEMFLKSDILILTSRYEGYPTVITEALTYGIPPIVTPGTNALFLAKDNIGWETKLNSLDIAKQIEKSVNEFLIDKIKIKSKCMLYVEKELGLNKISVAEELYERLCKK